ncbi:hypothetical protein VTJ04DRAFT_1095 [Mycothermus thermophilus]|uniref:uncharacterized protein n=1 Tax=Humicola insolens TaxID=85995 RepID=UPI0037431DE5
MEYVQDVQDAQDVQDGRGQGKNRTLPFQRDPVHRHSTLFTSSRARQQSLRLRSLDKPGPDLRLARAASLFLPPHRVPGDSTIPSSSIASLPFPTTGPGFWWRPALNALRERPVPWVSRIPQPRAQIKLGPTAPHPSPCHFRRTSTPDCASACSWCIRLVVPRDRGTCSSPNFYYCLFNRVGTRSPPSDLFCRFPLWALFDLAQPLYKRRLSVSHEPSATRPASRIPLVRPLFYFRERIDSVVSFLDLCHEQRSIGDPIVAQRQVLHELHGNTVRAHT